MGTLGALSGAGVMVGSGAGGSSPCSSSESLDGGRLTFCTLSPEVREAIESVKYIAENMRLQSEAKEVRSFFFFFFVCFCFLQFDYDMKNNM